jgi:hypothetical protein
MAHGLMAIRRQARRTAGGTPRLPAIPKIVIDIEHEKETLFIVERSNTVFMDKLPMDRNVILFGYKIVSHTTDYYVTICTRPSRVLSCALFVIVSKLQ